jgi:hypothetical protein
MAHVPRKPTRKAGVGSDPEGLAGQIAGLLTLDVSTLRARWAAVFGADPSLSFGRLLMVRAIAYRLQEKAFAGIKPSTERLLERVADGGWAAAREHTRKRRPSAGTVLIREWRGVSHRVTVFDKDVVYRGRHYQSLSEVARAITGSRWSGPLFFGLKQGAKQMANG